MDDRGKIALSIGIGALLGGVAGYLFLTERGRDVRVNFEPRLNELLTEVDKLRTTFERTRSAVADGLASFNQLMNEQPSSSSPRPASGARAGSTGSPVTGPTLWTRGDTPGSTH